MPAGTNPADLAEFGIGTEETPADALSTLDLNDPDIAALIASFEAQRPDPKELLKEIEEQAKAPETPAPEQADAETAPITEPPDPSTAPDAETTPPPPVWDVDFGDGRKVSLTQEQARELVELGNWARSLPRETLEAMAAVEDGRGYVIPREEAAAYQAWKAAGSKPSATPATPSLDSLDYSTEAEQVLAQKLAALEGQVAASHEQQVAAETRRIQAEQQRQALAAAEVFETTFMSTGAELNLTPEQVNSALQYAADHFIIQDVSKSLTHVSPTGQILRPADPAQVARETLTRAIDAVPELRQIRIEAEIARRMEVERAAILATNEKKNRAASLASAPSAATTSNVDVRTMTQAQLEAAMANDIRAALAAG